MSSTRTQSQLCTATPISPIYSNLFSVRFHFSHWFTFVHISYLPGFFHFNQSDFFIFSPNHITSRFKLLNKRKIHAKGGILELYGTYYVISFSIDVLFSFEEFVSNDFLFPEVVVSVPTASRTIE